MARPTKEVEIENKKNRQRLALLDLVLKGNDIVVENYVNAVETIALAARGELKDCSPQNQLSSAKLIKEWGEKILAESKKELSQDDNGDEDVPEETNSSPVSLISMQVVNGGKQ